MHRRRAHRCVPGLVLAVSIFRGRDPRFWVFAFRNISISSLVDEG